VLISS